MSIVIDFAEARARRDRLRTVPLRGAQWDAVRDLGRHRPGGVRPASRAITDLSLTERLYLPQAALPYVSGLPAAFLEQGRRL